MEAGVRSGCRYRRCLLPLIDVEAQAHELEDHASRDNMGLMSHPAADTLRRMLEDITFLTGQLDIIEHAQDDTGIAEVRARYGLKRGWE